MKIKVRIKSLLVVFFSLASFLTFFLKVNAQTPQSLYLQVRLINNLSPRIMYRLVVYAKKAGGEPIECFRPPNNLPETIGYCRDLEDNVAYNIYAAIYDVNNPQQVGVSPNVSIKRPQTVSISLTVSNENLYSANPVISQVPTPTQPPLATGHFGSACPREKEGNLDCDSAGCINEKDYEKFKPYFGHKIYSISNNSSGSPDFNDDGIVDTADFEIIRQNYNTCL